MHASMLTGPHCEVLVSLQFISVKTLKIIDFRNHQLKSEKTKQTKKKKKKKKKKSTQHFYLVLTGS